MLRSTKKIVKKDSHVMFCRYSMYFVKYTHTHTQFTMCNQEYLHYLKKQKTKPATFIFQSPETVKQLTESREIFYMSRHACWAWVRIEAPELLKVYKTCLKTEDMTLYELIHSVLEKKQHKVSNIQEICELLPAFNKIANTALWFLYKPPKF